MKEALENVIKELFAFGAGARGQEKSSVINLAAYMEQLLKERKIDDAFYLYTSTIRQLKRNLKELSLEFINCVTRCSTRLSISEAIKIPDHQNYSGTAIIHRVWVGKYPDDNMLWNISVANNSIASIWHQYNAPQDAKVRVRQILWSDNTALVEGAPCFDLKNLEVIHIDEIFAGTSDNRIKLLEPFVRSFLRRKEYNFVADLMRYILIYLYGGLYCDATWKKISSQCHEASFTPNDETVKATFMLSPGGTKINAPGLEKGEYYKGFMKTLDIKDRACGSVYGSIDSNLLYVGSPHHVVMTRTLDILLELLVSGSKAVNFPLTDYRRHRAEIAKSFMDEKAVKAYAYAARGSEVGSITNLYPICQSLADFGYVYLKSMAAQSPYYDLRQENRFEANLTYHGILQVKELGLERGEGGSWYRPNPKYQLSAED